MSRIAELLHHPTDYLPSMPRALSHRPKSSVGGIVLLVGMVALLAWMWPEIQRYIKIKRM